MARRSPPPKVTYLEPVAPRLARNTAIESTFDPAAVIRPEPGEWHPRMPEGLDDAVRPCRQTHPLTGSPPSWRRS
jgi:hypothetical protein